MTSAPPTEEQQLTLEVERLEQSRVTLRVEAPAAELETAIRDALRRYATRVRIPGFRPGKAPAAMVERAVGWESVRQEAMDQLLPELYARALRESGLVAVSEPEVDLDTVERGQPVKFTATLTIAPEVDLGDYLTALRVEEERGEVTDEQVDKTIEELRRRHAELIDVERPAQAGDSLRCTLTMHRGDEVVSGDEGPRDLDIDREALIPGLADAVIGLSAGEERDFDLFIPEEFHREELRGVTVRCHIAVATVREPKLPPLDDSLAELDGHGSTLEELREHYQSRLIDLLATQDDEKYEAAVLDALRDRVSLEVPEVMVERDIDRQVNELEIRLRQMGMSLDSYLSYTNQAREAIRGEMREASTQRVKLEMVLDALIEAEGLEVDESQVEREEQRLTEGQKLTAEQRRRLHHAAHVDLSRRAAAQRAMEIARGQG